MCAEMLPLEKKALFILNPVAGRKLIQRNVHTVVRCLMDHAYLVTTAVTASRGEACELAARYGASFDLIVCAGGDGTLNECVNGMAREGISRPIGYIPCGSTNDFASGLELPLAPLLACDSIVLGNPRPLDVGLFGSDRYFSYTASFGAFTSVSWSTSQNVKNVLGHAAYILEGIRSLADIHPIHMKVTADGHEYEDDYIFGAVCNSTSLGGVLKLDDSEVHMSDGLFEALLIPFPPDLLVLNRILTALRTHCYDDPSLYFLRASSFVFEGAPEITWTLDGEAAEGTSRVEIKNIHNAISLIY